MHAGGGRRRLARGHLALKQNKTVESKERPTLETFKAKKNETCLVSDKTEVSTASVLLERFRQSYFAS